MLLRTIAEYTKTDSNFKQLEKMHKDNVHRGVPKTSYEYTQIRKMLVKKLIYLNQ